jgi:NTP pyrophosphatase (non-canonical NTP hydrolase)
MIDFKQVERFDQHLDAKCAVTYKEQPLAQDWARVAKIAEEAGEAVDALIGMTGQNPRKGYYAEGADLLDELADAAFTAVYAIQHFTKDIAVTRRALERHQEKVLKTLEAAGE